MSQTPVAKAKMMKFVLLTASLLSASLLSSVASARADDLPFVGMWDCEGSTLSFSEFVYDDGSQSRDITEAQEGTDGSYAVFVGDDTYVTLSDITSDSMRWTASDDSGMSLECVRIPSN